MKTHHQMAMLACTFSLFTVPLVWAADPTSAAPDRLGVESTVPSPTANQVLTDIHRINAMEIDMGKLAQTQASSPAVRGYAQVLVQDHENAQKRVTNLASDRNLSIGQKNETSSGESATTFKDTSIAQLNSLKGAAFDRAFLKQMVSDHNDAAKMLRSAESKLSDSPDVKKLVTSLIPVIEQHLSKANDLLKKMGKSS
jgi:putative membrane protein